MKVKKLLALMLSAMIILSGMVFSVSADTVTPLAIVKYSQSSPIIDYTTAKSANSVGSLVYGSNCTASYNSETGAIDVTASTGSNYVYTYYDNYFSVTNTTNCCFAILYKTTSSTLLGAANFDKGYYANSMNASGIITTSTQRPVFTTQTVAIGGEDYYLATATLDNSTAGIASGTKIYGIRFNVVTTGTPYSILSSGVFSSSEDAVAYFNSDLTAPEFAENMAITATDITDNSMNISWNAATDNVTAAANITYKVYASASPITAEKLSQAVLCATVTGNTTATAGGLTAETAYYFAVQAVDEASNSSVWFGDTAYTTTALQNKVTPLAFVDFDSDSPIYTDSASLSGSFFSKAGGIYNSATDAITTSPNASQVFVCYFDEAVTLDADTNSTVYAAVLYSGTSTSGNGYLMNGIGSDGLVYNSGITRPAFTTTAITRSGETVNIAYAAIDVSNHGYDGKKIYGIRMPQVAGTYNVYAAGIFATLSDATAVFSDTTAPSFSDGDVEVSGSGMVWQLSWNEAVDGITPTDEITYKVYTSTEEVTEITGAPALTVKGDTCAYLAGLKAQSDNYISIVAEDTVGNTAAALNVCVVTTDKAFSYSYTSFDSNTTYISEDLSELICGGTVMTGGSASADYDSEKDAIKVTATSSGSDYIAVYLDVAYAINYENDNELYFAIAYQSDRDIIGNSYLYSSYSKSVIAVDNTAYRPVLNSMNISVDGTSYKMAYVVIDVTENDFLSRIIGIRTPGSLGVTAGSDFYLYGAGLFPSLADAHAALFDDAVPEFTPNVTVKSDAESITVDFDAATDGVLFSDSVMYTVYASTSAITADNLAESEAYISFIGKTSIRLGGLIADTAYYYAIVAEDAGGNKTVWSSTETVSTFKLGDINCDGSVNGTDLTILRKHIVGSEVNDNLVMDFNDDNAVNIKDIVRLKKIIAGIEIE